MAEPATCDVDGCGVSPAPLGWMPPRFAWALLALGCAGHFALGAPVLVRAPAVGVLLAVVGLWVAVATKRRFRTLGLALPPQATPTLLLTDGWFAISRNPMYVGIALVLLGVGLVLGSMPALLPGPLFLWIVRHWFVPMEEDHIAALAGPQWDSYARRVPRWL